MNNAYKKSRRFETTSLFHAQKQSREEKNVPFPPSVKLVHSDNQNARG